MARSSRVRSPSKANGNSIRQLGHSVMLWNNMEKCAYRYLLYFLWYTLQLRVDATT
jgi:hypothetical protein